MNKTVEFFGIGYQKGKTLQMLGFIILKL